MKVLFFLSQMSVTNGENINRAFISPTTGSKPCKRCFRNKIIKKNKQTTEWFWNCICGMTSYNRFPLLRWEYRRGSNVHTTAYRRCWFSWKFWRISGRAMVRASGATSSAAHLGRTFRRGRGTCDGARPGKKVSHGKIKKWGVSTTSSWVFRLPGRPSGRFQLECNTAGNYK